MNTQHKSRTGRTRLPGFARRVFSDKGGFGLVEMMIALTILAVGLMAVTGLSLGTASQVRSSSLLADQTLAGQLALEEVRRAGFATAASGVDTITVNGRDYLVTLTVTSLSPRVKQVVALVPGTLGQRSFVSRIDNSRPLPAPPVP